MAEKRTRPAGRAAGPNKHTLSYQLREIIDARGLCAYAVAKLAEIDPGILSRFLSGARDIRLATADRIAAALGLRLVEVGKVRRGRPARAVETADEGDNQGADNVPDALGAGGDDGDPRGGPIDQGDGDDEGGESEGLPC